MIRRLIDGIAATAGAAVLSQCPAFLSQYQQQIAGRAAQARLDVAGLLHAAAQHGLSPEQYLSRAASEGGKLSLVLVSDARHTMDALTRLQATYDSLVRASPLARPIVFVDHLDLSAVKATFANFTPAVPLTTEGLIYAAAGLLLGLSVAAGLQRLFKLTMRAAKPAHKGT
jgi:hypothetical protein